MTEQPNLYSVGFEDGFKDGYKCGYEDGLDRSEARSTDAERKLKQMTQICRAFLADVGVATSAVRETIRAIDEGKIND